MKPTPAAARYRRVDFASRGVYSSSVANQRRSLLQPMARIGISVIVPTLDETQCIDATLAALQFLRRDGHEIIVVDGGSTDDTVARAEPQADLVLVCAPGRAQQMNAGARAASGSVLWFVHADTRVSGKAVQALQGAIARGYQWGRFDVRLSGEHWLFRIIAWSMNLRSRLSGIATGDQGIFVETTLFERLGGFTEIALMEDIELSRRLKSVAPPACLKTRLTTSSRRWQKRGALRTILLMWWLRFAYALGMSPNYLARLYR